MSDYGVDLTRKELRISETECNAKDGLNRDTLVSKKSWLEQPKAWKGRSLSEWAADVTGLGDESPREDQFNPGVPRNKIPGLNLGLGQPADLPTARVYAIPFGLTPVVRNRLPEILLGGGGVFVEAGLALVLETIGRRDRDPFPSLLATLTPSGADHELALIDVEFRTGRKGRLPTLVLACKRTLLLPEGRFEDLLAETMKTEESLETPRQLIALKDHSDDLAKSIALRLGWREEPWSLDPDAIAKGASRFLHARDKPRYLGNLVDAVVMERCLPQPLGVLVTVRSKGENRWCWRKLFKAGHPHTSENPISDIVSPRPSEKPFLLLAESRNPSFCHSKWIGQDQWKEADLHWHATPQVPPRPALRPGVEVSSRSRWMFRLEWNNLQRMNWDVREIAEQ
jgi:hypothetical protein